MPNVTIVDDNQKPVLGISGAADGGAASFKMGGVYSAVTPPSLAVGQRGDLQLDSSQNLRVRVGLQGNGLVDGQTTVGFWGDTNNSAGANIAMVTGMLSNGTSLDTPRGNVNTAALINYAGAVAGSNGADLTNYNGRGVKVVVDVTAITAGSITVTIQGKDIASGKYYPILQSAAIAAVSTVVLEVYPGIGNVANLTAGVALPRTWRVITAIATGPVTATVGASVIL